jgi:flagellar hook-associated protein 3 FlgL
MAFLSSLEQAQQRILRTQAQVATGLRVNQPSDDPFASARIGELGASISRLEQYQANGGIARTRLGLEEQALAAVIDNLQRVRELTVQANSDTLSNSDRAAVAAELRERFDSVLGLANAADASGNFLFAGYSEANIPFAATPGGVVYSGDAGQRLLQVSDNRFVAVNDAGSEVFQRIVNGNGTFVLAADPANTGTGVLGRGTADVAAYVQDDYTITFVTATDYEVRDGGGGLVIAGTYANGQSLAFPGANIEFDGTPAAGDVFTVAPSTSSDLFATVQGLIDTLESDVVGGASGALLHNRIGQLMVDLDQALGHIIDVRSEIGARLHALDQEADLVEGFSAQLTETLSDLRDLDYAEALSLLAQQLFGLEAAQQSYARTQNLSLFRFL